MSIAPDRNRPVCAVNEVQDRLQIEQTHPSDLPRFTQAPRNYQAEASQMVELRP